MDLLKKKRPIIDFCEIFSLTNISATLSFVQSEGKLIPASSNWYDSLNIFRFEFKRKVISPKDTESQHKSLLRPFLTPDSTKPTMQKVW